MQQGGLSRGQGGTEPLWRPRGGRAGPGPTWGVVGAQPDSPGADGCLGGQRGLHPPPRPSGGWKGLRLRTWG